MIKVYDNYYLDSDNLSIRLLMKGVIKDEKSKRYGEETIKVIGYYPTVSSLKSALLEKLIIQNVTLLENIDKVIEIKNEIINSGDN